jgi:hypothetical protein
MPLLAGLAGGAETRGLAARHPGLKRRRDGREGLRIELADRCAAPTCPRRTECNARIGDAPSMSRSGRTSEESGRGPGRRARRLRGRTFDCGETCDGRQLRARRTRAGRIADACATCGARGARCGWRFDCSGMVVSRCGGRWNEERRGPDRRARCLRGRTVGCDGACEGRQLRARRTRAGRIADACATCEARRAR